jgi:7-carboxy-7-deazaguanine synthase
VVNTKKIPLVEVFGPTIQGEGVVIGQQTYFLRFGLCDYKCTRCDSMHAVDPHQVRANAKWLTQQEIANELEAIHLQGSTKWVTFTGGNPCIHDLGELVHTLRSSGWHINVETQGTAAPDWLTYVNLVTVSPKGPGMGEDCNLEVLDEFYASLVKNGCHRTTKIVIFDQRDLEFARMVFERYQLWQTGPAYLSLGNPWPPGLDLEGAWTPHHHIEAMCAALGNYKRLFEDIQTDPILSKTKFLPQWHWFVWGNEKGR